MSGICGYGRYDDDPEYVGCPRAKSDMTPCIARDGHLALAQDPDVCVGCGADPWDLLVEVKHSAHLSPPSRSQSSDHFADQLQKIVRRVTSEPLPEGEKP